MERTPLNKGVRTALQAIVGSLIGLVLVVWAVPGVPEAVIEYAKLNAVPLLLVIGIPSGVVAWIQNRLGK
jgi:hypothetical protein